MAISSTEIMTAPAAPLPATRALVAVLTCTRPGQVSYLRHTLNSLVWQGGLYDLRQSSARQDPSKPSVVGWFAMHDGPLGPGIPKPAAVRVMEPGGMRELFFPVDTFKDAPNMGVRENLWRTFKYALQFPNWDRLILFEDDVQFLGKNSLYRMITCPFLPDEGLITFHDMKELTPTSPYGLYHLRVTGREKWGLWGLQAAAFPRHVIDFLAPQNYWAPWADKPRQESDRTVEYFLDRSPWPYQSVHCPSLVRHIGAISAANPDLTLANRISPREASDDFDAGLLVGNPETRF